MLTKKQFENIISETASGFKPNYGNAQPQALKTPTPIQASQKRQSQTTALPDYDKVELVDDPKVLKGAEWAKYGGNFPIKRNGRIFYVSRSVAVSMCAFCKDKNGNWCVLANQRGPGCNSSVGLWNIPAGYLDYGESAEEAAARETWEETGVNIPNNVPFRLLGTNANNERDDVSMAYTCVLDGTTDDWPLSAENSEPGEVADIKWIPIMYQNGKINKEFLKYRWNRNPYAIYGRAQTALMPYVQSDDKYDVLVKKLKKEIGTNPTALFLLDKILSMKNNMQQNTTI